MQILPLFNFSAASTLSALLERTALIDSTSLLLVWDGCEFPITVTVTFFKALPGTGFL
jgi:hypothetical protein